MEIASTVITVENKEELEAALRTARGGEIIELKGGDYGDLSIVGEDVSFGEEVTIRSADTDSPATFSEISLRNVANLTFDSIAIEFVSEAGLDRKAADEQNAVSVSGSTNITIRNSVFEGDTHDEPGSTIEGLPVGVGIFVRGSDDVTVEGNEFSNWGRAAKFRETTDLTVEGNDVHSIRSDGMNFADVDRVLIQGNHFHDFLSYASVSDHRDMIQFWTAGTDSPSTDIVIRDNIMNSGSGVGTQTILMGNELVSRYGAGEEMFYRNVTIENNLIYNSHLHGITVGQAADVLVRNNTLLHNQDSGSGGSLYLPTIRLSEQSKNVTVEKNITSAVTDAPSGATIRDNLIVQDSSPDEANYYEHLFINALVGGNEADIAALQALPGGIVEKGGYGSTLTRYNPTPDELTAIVRNEGQRGDTFAFNGLFSANSDGRVDEDNARFQWDMGDGTILEGIGVSHTYSTPGMYKVKLTVTHEDGSVDTAFSEAYIPEAVRLSLDATKEGVVDLSTYDVSPPSDAIVLYDGDRYAMRLSDNVGFGVWAPVFDMDAFSISMDIRALDGSDSAGEIFRLHTNMLLTVGSDGSFNFNFENAEGDIFKLRTGNTNALNGSWHDLDLTYSDASGRLTFYLDGEEIESIAASGLTQPRESWAPNFGAKFQTGFDGLIDDVRILDKIQGEQGEIETPAPAPEEEEETPDPTPAPEEEEETPDPTPAPEEEDDTPDPIPAPGGEAPGGIEYAVMDFSSPSLPSGVDLAGNATISAGGTVLLDGNGDYVSMDRRALPEFTGAVSVAFDLRFDEAPSKAVQVLWQHTNFGLQLRDGQVKAAVATADDGVRYTNGVDYDLFDGSWHRLALSIDSLTDTLRLYADGALLIEETGLDIELSDTSRPLRFGSDGWNGYMDGEIDDIVIGNAAIEYPDLMPGADEGEVDSPDPTPAPEEEEEASDPIPAPGGEAPDGVEYAVMDFSSPSLPSGVDLAGNATISAEETVLLDGNGDYVSMDREALPDFTGAVSVAFDLRFDEAPSKAVQVLWQHTNFGLQLRDGQVKAAVATADDGVRYTNGVDHDLFDGSWHRLALSIDSETDTLRLYADGDLLIEETGLDIELSDTSRPLRFGSDGWNGYMDGEIDDIVVGNAALDTMMVDSEAWVL